MTDLLVCFAGMVAAVAPFGALVSVLACRRAADSVTDSSNQQLILLAPAAAFAALALAALLSDPSLDLLSVSGPDFEYAAAAVMVPLAVRLIIFGDSMAVPGWKLPRYSWLAPFSVPLLAGPVSLIAAVSYSERFGVFETIAATATALAIAAGLLATLSWWQRTRIVYVHAIGRLSGVLLMAMAVEMALDGVYRI